MKYMPLALVLIGLGISIFGQWLALSLYLNTKLKKQAENMATFVVAIAGQSSSVELPNPEENLAVVRSPVNNVFVQSKIKDGQDQSSFASVLAKSKDGSTQANIYYKNISLSEFLNFIKSDPISLGISLIGAIVAIFGTLLRPKPKQVVDKSSGILISTAELKALKLAIAFGGIIPKQSLIEAKAILEGIIKKKEGK
ncbi:MAG: hypothetical protein ABDH18_01925 [Aquificaceae bacterium]